MLYKAEYKDECFELIPASNHHKAILEALDIEGKHRTLLNVILIDDDDYSDIQTTF